MQKGRFGFLTPTKPGVRSCSLPWIAMFGGRFDKGAFLLRFSFGSYSGGR